MNLDAARPRDDDTATQRLIAKDNRVTRATGQEDPVTQVAVRLALFDFLEGWYNPHRRHSALDYESPMRYEFKHHPQVA